ncbi:MAG: hypothetical protein KC502_02825 [Myxococcales bacterium]|nr:hypothetical protein [Myxococcales bacterium]
MSELNKETFVAIVEAIVAGFEDPAFQAQFAAAKAAGDMGQLVALPTGVQTAAFTANGLDAATGAAAFKAAGRQFAADPAVGALLVRMKAAL